MSIEISIWTILKLSLAVLGTYYLLPLVLVGRDSLLWWLMDKFVLTSELHQKIRQHAEHVEQWNNELARKSNMSFKQGEGTKFFLDGKEVSHEEWISDGTRRDSLAKTIEAERWYIQKRGNLTKWLLKHYKQDEDNPIDRWAKEEAGRAARKYEEKAVKKLSQQNADKAGAST